MARVAYHHRMAIMLLVPAHALASPLMSLVLKAVICGYPCRHDWPGQPLSSKVLVNDLDLLVSGGKKSRRPVLLAD